MTWGSAGFSAALAEQGWEAPKPFLPGSRSAHVDGVPGRLSPSNVCLQPGPWSEGPGIEPRNSLPA